jgi:hypothetical protein
MNNLDFDNDSTYESQSEHSFSQHPSNNNQLIAVNQQPRPQALNNGSIGVETLLDDAIRCGSEQDMMFYKNVLQQQNELKYQSTNMLCNAVTYRVTGRDTGLTSGSPIPMLTYKSKSSNTACEEFNNKRIYSNSVFTSINQAPVSNETFTHVVSLKRESFIRGNLLHNVFQILLRIHDIWMANDLVIEMQDYDMRHIFQRRETGHPNKDKAHTCSKLYVDNPPLDLNDIISSDVSLLENIIRFFYHFSSNYAFFVMENEDETRIENTLSKSVRNSRLKDLKKELPKRTDYIKANKMDNVIAYENQRISGKANNVARKQILTEGSEQYLSMYQDKDLLTLPFIRKIYQWMLEKYIYCLNIPVEIDDLYVTINNVNYPIIKENQRSAGDGRRMNYRTIVKHILSLLGLYDALESEINIEDFDFFDMLGIQEKVDGRKNNGKRKRDDYQDETTSNKRARSHDDDDRNDEESDDDESMENDLDN